jgi:signal transduction histidine kinase/ligand-binding sensor domain-containing protein
MLADSSLLGHHAGAAEKERDRSVFAQWFIAGMVAFAPADAATQFATAPASVLATTPYFRTLGVAEGLPSSDVREIVQDRDGYIWIGTADGLARYDGVGFKVYRHDANDLASLSGNDIWALYVDRDNRIWCGGEDAGLNMLDARRAGFAHYQHDDKNPASIAKGDVYTIAQSADGAIWTGGYASGVNRLDPAGKAFTHYRHRDGDADSLVSDDVFVLRGDKQGRTWVGSIAGLDVLDRDAHVHHVDFSAVPGSGKINAVALFEEPDGSMLVGMRRGVVRVGADLRAQVVVADGLTDTRIRSLARDARGELWIGTQHGLNRAAIDGRLHGYLNDAAVPGSMPGVRIASVFGDREGAMWFATTEAGIGRLPPSWRGFALFRGIPGDAHSLSANSGQWQGLAENPDGRIWSVNVDGGIDLLDAQSGSVERHSQWAVPGKQLHSALVARDGKLWVGHAAGLRIYDTSTGAFEDLPVDAQRDDALLRGQIDLLTQDATGAVWAKSYGAGLNRIDAATHAIEQFDSDRAGLRSADIDQIGFDPSGALLVATVAGLDRLDAQQKKFSPVPGAPGQRVLAFAFAADGTLWLHTIGALEHYRYERGALAPIDRVGAADGWPALSLGGMQIDRRGKLWIASARGLWRFDPRTRAIRVFDAHDGLASAEFTRLPLLQRRDGAMFGGTLAGVVGWVPEQLDDAPNPASPLLIDAITVRREGSDAELDAHTSRLVFDWRDRDLRVQARLLSYVAPAAHRYQWRLDGQEHDWVASSANGERSFSRLAPGSYRLHVRAAASDGVWQELAAPLVIEMPPPPWASAWAYAAYLLAAIVAGWLALRSYRRRLDERHAIALAERQREFAESANAAKTSFLATMGHEIRTPMTGVLGMTELLLGTNLSEKQRGYAESIASSGQTMLRLVNDSLDLARIEAGKLELEDAPFDLHALVTEIGVLGATLAPRKGLAFTTTIAPDAPQCVRGDAVRVRQIFQNLVNNALKFTEHGSVDIALVRRGVGIEFRVRDSGPGIDAATQARLFHRFEQADGARRHGGSGLGLAICRDLAVLMGGEIALDSAPGQGSTFRAALPLIEVSSAQSGNVENSTMRHAATSTVAQTSVDDALHVLLVEDDATVAAVIVGLIEAQGHRVRRAAHGLAALSEFAVERFDVALIDFDLPGFDGLALARMLREREIAESKERLYLIGVTARSAGNEEQLALEAGMDVFVRKPLTGAVLRTCFVRLAASRRAAIRFA